ncbi:MAG TPA: sialidase family protein [Cyclobacteriaceae bacterium]|nr:sialidase family protein [Cyclobacteriaceae bacterium]
MKILPPVVLSIVLFNCTGSNKTTVGFSPIRSFPSPAAKESIDPHLFRYNDVVYLSWLEVEDTTATFKYSTLEGESWAAAQTITSGNTWFVNWADYPSMAINGETFIAHYLDRSGPGKYSYDVKYLISGDGKNWNGPTLLNDDGKDAEHGFVSIVPYNEDFFVAWLDGRDAVMEGMDHEGHHGSMSLRGAILDRQGKKLKEWLLDERVCDCCQTTAAVTGKGPIVVYRDRSDDEVRDMSVVRLVDNEWTKPASIYEDQWEINGCPVNGPRVSAMGDDVAVAWFSAPGDSTQVKVIFSNDGGAGFTKPVLINGSKTSGRVDVELLGPDNAIVSWIENDSIQVAKVSSNGRGSARAVSRISTSRASGFPQMTKVGERLIFAWTDVETRTVQTAGIDINR